jgi:two-component system sensor histidine kinase BaeS
MRSLSVKLILAFLVVSVTGTALVAVLALLTTASQFDRYIASQLQEGLIIRLSDYYQNKGSWDDFSEAVPRLILINPNVPRLAGGQAGLPSLQGEATSLLLDNNRRAIITGLGYKEGDTVSAADWRRGVPIISDGRQVGRLIVARNFFRRGLVGAELVFLNRVKNIVILGTVGATIAALLIGVFLARTLTRPLRELTEATKAVAQGDLAQQVPVRSQDELGQLAIAFNQMNADLARARDLQRQMTADIAHDLRTPLSIVLGHAEALSEGVLPPTEETFQTIHEEARHLSRLIDDLRTLSLAEAGELFLIKRWITPEKLLARAARAYDPQARQKQIAISVQSDGNLPELFVDPERLAQVMDNILDNALRHTPVGGKITLVGRMDPEAAPAQIQFEVQNNGPSISPDELPHIFERFYRSDKSRMRREDGGSGLGLAIARSIVEAHNGRIWAESKPGEGVSIAIVLPVSQSDEQTHT